MTIRSLLLEDLVEPLEDGAHDARPSSPAAPLASTQRSGMVLPAAPDGLAAPYRGADAGGAPRAPEPFGALVGERDPMSGEPTQQLAIISGTEYADILTATAATIPENFIGVAAYGGDDLIVRDRTGDMSGNDDITIDGGEGHDTVDYSQAVGRVVVDFLFGTVQELAPIWAPPGSLVRSHDDLISIEAVIGTDHDDIFSGNHVANEMHGGDGDDEMFGYGGEDLILGGDDDDYIDGGDDDDLLHGGQGDDAILGGAGNDLITGGSGSDDILGQDGDDTIIAGSGDDLVFGGAGNDTIHVGSGNDTVWADGDDDTVHLAGAGDNTLHGGTGVDRLVITGPVDSVSLYHGWVDRPDGFDTISGFENLTTGNDAQSIIGSDVANDIRSNGGNDVVLGNGGNDFVLAGDGDDIVDGGSGHDSLRGGNGNDTVLGGYGNDTIFGNDGNDTLNGDEGADAIRGGRGADTIRGGDGNDDLRGGAHADTFVWGVGDGGTDTIADFSLAQDKLSFLPGFLAAGPITSVLGAIDAGDLGAALLGHTAHGGLKVIAYLEGVDADALSQAIVDGSIFQVETTGLGDDAPGGFDFGGLGGGVLPLEPQGGLLL
ncbi:calcium-binding protein [Salinarimonas rosea]|uniref:calcium-binding protein n=1 Tax=Salinarimonas rosea TaxID=552063 RepID=UPI00041E71E8|nr:calcium-binding protein [Salinarimonas rosea]